MTSAKLNQIKEYLPKQYGKLISQQLIKKKITPLQVRRVFRGEITNPDIVNPVATAAGTILTKTKKSKALISKLLKNTKHANN